ncbi:hypothetical protein [Marinifilum sp. D714]|uniref:hypothetical protein n=1 Tax=Marinifilum sp. D714 TaxID=2937523 RepID=UPI0027C1113D|nr:hypothetical protein [Marinifilum sp. D714]MDQ2179313.1 hypothetical protein [Marinifilum sp. D714]
MNWQFQEINKIKSLLVTLICLFSFACTPYSERVLLPLELKGVVSNTYIDYHDHAIRVVGINQENEYIEIYVTREDNKDFYENICKGDSIKKDSNSLDFYVRNNKCLMRYTID